MKSRTNFTFSTTLLAWSFIAIACLCATACGKKSVTEILQQRAEAKPVQLDSEQVSLTAEQLNCGVNNDLWDSAPPEAGAQASYRLTDKGRDLQFSDNVYASGSGFSTPYVQVRGKFNLQIIRIAEVSDTNDGSKLAQAQIGVKIAHPCFAASLPLMGVRKGKFSPDALPSLRFEPAEDSWEPVELIH